MIYNDCSWGRNRDGFGTNASEHKWTMFMDVYGLQISDILWSNHVMFTQLTQADLIQEEARRAAAKEEIHWDPMIFHGLLYKYSFARCNSIYTYIYIYMH